MSGFLAKNQHTEMKLFNFVNNEVFKKLKLSKNDARKRIFFPMKIIYRKIENLFKQGKTK